MRHRATAVGVSLALLALVLAGAAWARNPNCAGGIQYLVQGTRDKEKGNLEDYQREMLKAVDRLQLCATEDPEDFEALAYLGWAYAEVDSACLAGQAFEKAIAGLKGKGDVKKAELAISNRESYWAKNFNEGVADIQAAQTAYPEYTKDPADDGERALKAEASNKYSAALAALGRAACLKPGDGRTARNRGTVYALMGELVKAEAVLREGLVAAPADTDLANALGLVRRQYANKLLDDKKYDEAIRFYDDLLQSSANEPDLHSGSADAYFKRALGFEVELATARSALGRARAGAELTAATKVVDSLTALRNRDFRKAGDEYSQAATLKGNEADLVFNAALAYQNGTEFTKAEQAWRLFLTAKPHDTEGLSALGSTLVELKRYDEAAAAVHKAVNLDPKEKKYHRQLGMIYSAAGSNEASTPEIMVFLALNSGTPAENPAEAAQKAPASSVAGTTLASMGTPEQVLYWEGQGQKFETWFYWAKNVAYTFSNNLRIAKSDWGAPPPKLEKPAAPAAPARAGKKK